MQFSGIERLKEMFHVFRFDAAAQILHCDPHRRLAGRFVALAGNRQDAPLVFQASHRLDAVHHQVQQHLLELDAVAGYARQVFGQSCSHFDAVLGEFAMGKSEHVGNDITELERSLFRQRASGHRPDAPDDGAGAVGVVDDVRQDLERFIIPR